MAPPKPHLNGPRVTGDGSKKSILVNTWRALFLNPLIEQIETFKAEYCYHGLHWNLSQVMTSCLINIQRKKAGKSQNKSSKWQTGQNIPSLCVNAEILPFGYLMTLYPSGMRRTGSMMGLEPQGFTQILPSLLATKFVWFISSRYGSAKGSLTPCFN